MYHSSDDLQDLLPHQPHLNALLKDKTAVLLKDANKQQMGPLCGKVSAY